MVVCVIVALHLGKAGRRDSRRRFVMSEIQPARPLNWVALNELKSSHHNMGKIVNDEVSLFL